MWTSVSMWAASFQRGHWGPEMRDEGTHLLSPHPISQTSPAQQSFLMVGMFHSEPSWPRDCRPRAEYMKFILFLQSLA